MKAIITTSILIGVLMGATLATLTLTYAPIDLYEATNVHHTTITWERDPAFVASMFKLQDDSIWTDIGGLNIGNNTRSTIIQEVPTTKRELQTFGHECLHSFGYIHD